MGKFHLRANPCEIVCNGYLVTCNDMCYLILLFISTPLINQRTPWQLGIPVKEVSVCSNIQAITFIIVDIGIVHFRLLMN